MTQKLPSEAEEVKNKKNILSVLNTILHENIILKKKKLPNLPKMQKIVQFLKIQKPHYLTA